MTRVTLDTNEYISAFAFRGQALRLLQMAVDGEIEIAISAPILSEVLRVLREKFEWPPYEIHAAGLRIARLTREVRPQRTINAIEYDPPDNRVIECALEADSGFIISEDKDLLRLGNFEGITIMRATAFLSQVGTK